jgi:DnaJ-class molecular chaperone
MANLYEVLGVGRNAGAAEIKIAFRALAKAHHPDLHGRRVLAEQRFKVINGAYEVLRDPAARAAYDAICALERGEDRRRMRGAALAMAASFVLTVTSGLLVAGWSDWRHYIARQGSSLLAPPQGLVR